MHWLDPDYLPETTGIVFQFLINPQGEIDGMILKDGTEVHASPHLSVRIGKAVAIGDTIKVRGVRPRGVDVIAAVAIDTANGSRILDDGPLEEHKKETHDTKKRADAAAKPGEASGTVVRALHGPKGEVCGVLLKDGMLVRFPKHEGERLSKLTKPGATFAARGKVIVNAFGRVLNAHEAGPSQTTLKPFALKQPAHEKSAGPKKPHHSERTHH